MSLTRQTSDMILVHKVFRRELRLLPQLIRQVLRGDSRRAALVASHARELVCAIRHHHAAEQDLLWPLLRACGALDEALVDHMRAAHRRHRELLSEFDALIPFWESDPEAQTGEAIADVISDLAAYLAEHLDAVEQWVFPSADRYITPKQWRAMGLRAAGWVSLQRIAVLLGALLEDATPAERESLMAKVPAPARFLYRKMGQKQYDQEMRALRAALPVAA